MAHTDRDDDRIFWRRHHRDECPNAWSRPRHGGTMLPCETCKSEPPRKYWCSTTGKPAWNRNERQVERSRAKRALRQCRDYDTMTITYHRPYWD
ncbi:hypothetical protein [Mycolicibacterium sp.]|uniref:hypothetical protein n=1 Tax=Mycolicibacterium sp. TaxID=2320850 RepID=UPI0037C5A4F6